MSDDSLDSWAARRTGRTGPTGAESTVTQAPPASPPAAQALPAPAPGYQWAWSPQHNAYIQVQVAAPPPAAPIRQPGTAPYVQPPHHVTPGTVPPPPGSTVRPKSVQTCTLVKPGDRDTYAEMLAGVPELVPDSGYDSMAGNPDPNTIAEMGAAASLMLPDAPVAHHPSRPPVTSVKPLKGGG